MLRPPGHSTRIQGARLTTPPQQGRSVPTAAAPPSRSRYRSAREGWEKPRVGARACRRGRGQEAASSGGSAAWRAGAPGPRATTAAAA
eukprot:scaffold3674_cov371-Prasinococcus_capsulatus_cf.AAC.1